MLPHFPYSFFTTSPPFITNFTCSKTVTSCSGSPSTAIDIAHAPGSSVPTLPDHPNRSAAFNGRSLNRLQRRQSQLHHYGKFMRI